MKKVTKQEKDENPKIYGYGSVAQLEADPSRFGDDPNDPLTHWVSFIDADDDKRFIPCNEKYFHMHRNEMRNEERRNNTARKQCPISIDQMFEDHDFEFVDPDYEEIDVRLSREELIDYMWELINKYPEDDQRLLRLFNQGMKDIEIAKELNKARSTIQEKRMKLIKDLKEKLTKFQK
jgi:hypothetical protein